MPKRYSEEDRAAVFIALQVNKGNVARSARETNIPEATVRDWKKQFAENPPDIETTEKVLTDFTTRAEAIRDKLLQKYEEALDAGKINPDKMPVHIGIFVDKVQLLKGLATTRSENVNALPSADQVRELASGVFDAMRQAISEADKRHEIIEGEFTEVENNPKELSAGAKKE